MAFDYGSIDIGLKNPFKIEGRLMAVRGLLQVATGIALLFWAVSQVKTDAVSGWILVGFGVWILGLGIKTGAGGTYAILRYFVGRNHPTSLAKNFSPTEASWAEDESRYVAYPNNIIEEMLVGRKNVTFVEPQGFLARLLHTLFPKLLFLPYPMRNLAQHIFGAWVKMLTALVAFGFVAFISLAGFAGSAGKLIFPVYAAVLVLYLVAVWFSQARGISRGAEKSIEAFGASDLVKVIAASIVLPAVVGIVFSWVITMGYVSDTSAQRIMSVLSQSHAFAYLIGIVVFAFSGSAVVIFLLRCRMAKCDPVAEVSEFRENWQESVHPNEIFINLDNLIMANRRYKEVPNRVYVALDPQLKEQVEGKGDFRGKLIQEVQPRVRNMAWDKGFLKARFAGLIAGNICHIASLVVLVLLAYTAVQIHHYSAAGFTDIFSDSGDSGMLEQRIVHLILSGVILSSFGSFLIHSVHLFYAEIQFNSLLIYFKCEGTFTESKISTGTGIHDSTRSENTLVRSSITPWAIVSGIVSTTFASTGMRNLEHPRYILEMHTAEQDLASIREDLISFLKNRESIAAITNVQDLGNASQIYQLNRQTRAETLRQQIDTDANATEADVAGYLRSDKDLEKNG